MIMGNVEPELCWAKNGMGLDAPSVFSDNGLMFHHRFVGLYKVNISLYSLIVRL